MNLEIEANSLFAFFKCFSYSCEYTSIAYEQQQKLYLHYWAERLHFSVYK